VSVSGGAVCHELRSADGERQAPGAGAPRAALRAALRTAGAGGSVAAMPAIRYLDSNVPASFKYAGLAPVAQLDRALPSEGRGQGFESLRARQLNQWFNAGTGQHSKEPSKRIASRRSNLERCFRRIAGTSEWSGILHYLESMHST
jgi:hypothetical protein